MHQINATLIAVAALLLPAFAQPNKAANPFIGRWDFNLTTPGGTRATWLGISEHDGKLAVWYQPTGGNVYELKDFKIDGAHLAITLSPTETWQLDASGDKLTGFQKRGTSTLALTGLRAPDLNRAAPAAWTKPEPLFNGQNLDGWEPMGSPASSHWTVQDGLLVNTSHGANLKSTRTFDDLKVHYEVNCPDHGNSGFYLRGRYEVQIEYELLTDNPPERRIGSIYGRIAPNPELPRTPGQWETFDVTLVGRTVTVVRNGVTIIDHKEIEGITGGALDANEGQPGPFYIQGDHTGGLKFRNITVSVPQR
ncbi:MAG: DUF1080 domain-containing protein [Bryobacteraceae bacterium]